MYSNAKRFFDVLTEAVEGAKSVDIATYGAYLGFSKGIDWHTTGMFPIPARNFIEKCPAETRIVVGYSNYDPPQCQGCEKYFEYAKNKGDSIGQVIDNLNLNIRLMPNCHAKLYRIDRRWWVGGINLGASEAYDFMVEIKSGKKKLQAYFNVLWNYAERRE